MATSGSREPEFEWVGGALCLDLANTVSRVTAEERHERLSRWQDLAAWARAAGLPGAGPALTPLMASQSVDRVHRFRTTLHQIFDAVASGGQPPAAAVLALETALEKTRREMRLRPSDDRWSWQWRAGVPLADRIIGAAAHSAGELLTSEEVSLVRCCANASCGWLFVDRSRGHRRRWCDMKVCGNKAKARAFYARKKRGTS